MNDLDVTALLRSLATGEAELAPVLEARTDMKIEGEYFALRKKLNPIARLLARALGADRSWVPLTLGSVSGRALFQSMLVALNEEPPLELGQSAYPDEPAGTRALCEKAQALGPHLLQTAEQMRDIVRDALAGRDVREKLAQVRRRDRLRGSRLALLELWRLREIVVLNGELSVGGLYSAPDGISFRQQLHCAQVLHGANAPNRFVVTGAWTSVKTERVERNLNSGASGKITIEVPNERLVDKLVCAWRTQQVVSMMIESSWALGTAADRYKLIGLGLPQGTWDDADRWVADLRAGRRRRSGSFSSRSPGAQLSWDFDDSGAGDLAE
jgi:hypothetical protein